ncbi:MAG: DUF45 domain-containing protein [Coriobacteriia bacterium]|nr:DUF45 domain-containing protein [Coriobacteriia bacterium]MBN2839868.1 DUF45 domain-containing protein [Coriobacteriia bacterium]
MTIDGEHVAYEVVRSDRRTVALVVGRDGTLRVRAPRWVSQRDLERFVDERTDWIARKRAEALARAWESPVPVDAGERARARELFEQRLDVCWERFARDGEVKPRLRLRTMRSRWGSLSPGGWMSLNTLLVRAPLECLDAVIYHELCHLRVRAHDAAFYRELARYVPAWRERRMDLRDLL